MLKEQKSRVVSRSYYSASAYGGVSVAYAYSDSASVVAGIGSRLAFKTKELAEYAGKQFIDIWTDFCLTKK